MLISKSARPPTPLHAVVRRFFSAADLLNRSVGGDQRGAEVESPLPEKSPPFRCIALFVVPSALALTVELPSVLVLS
ncbi:MAG: hypothetical protein FJ308_17940 [Planctomycetes bacterium]|nr:hypothetical protein [Planctomycetota bacterium]